MDEIIDNLVNSITEYNKDVNDTYTNLELLQEKLVLLIKECQTGYVKKNKNGGVDMGECNPR